MNGAKGIDRRTVFTSVAPWIAQSAPVGCDAMIVRSLLRAAHTN